MVPSGDRPSAAVESRRYDLAALEFEAVRDLLRMRLTTPLGQVAVESLQPCTDADQARELLAQAAELGRRRQAGDHPPLLGAVEVRTWLRPFFEGEHLAATRELADLKRLLRAASRCRTWLGARPDAPRLTALAASFPQLGDLVHELESIVDDRGEVLTTASAKLAETRQEIEVAETVVRAAVQRVLADPTIHRCLQTLEPAWRHGRPVFQVRSEFRDRVRGVLHDRSQSGATLFIEPSVVVEAANRLSDARAAEHREIQVILAQVGFGLRRCRADIEAAASGVTQLDLALARARLLVEDGFCVPEISASGPLRLHGARHPILVRRGGAIVPLDLALGDPHRLLVVTGPNTGGKTVALKTVGLLALMAMCGLPVPAAEGTQFPWFDGVFLDIGDEQAIAQNLSTFSSHVVRIARCLRLATAQSLVLLDELGAGTDPEEGGALGYAVLEWLGQRQALAVVTTHLGQLKEFAYRHPFAQNGAMAFDGKTLQPQFHLLVGAPGQSHALDIAGHLGIPEPVLRRAREKLGRRDATMEQAVQQVVDTRRLAEQDRQEIARLRTEIERREQVLRDQGQELARKELWLHEEADALVEEQLRGARTALDAELAFLANAPKPFGDRARDLRAQVAAILAASSVHRRRMKFLGAVRRDGVVYVARLGRRCIVKSLDRERELCTVEVGKMRVTVPFDDVSWIQPLESGA